MQGSCVLGAAGPGRERRGPATRGPTELPPPGGPLRVAVGDVTGSRDPSPTRGPAGLPLPRACSASLVSPGSWLASSRASEFRPLPDIGSSPPSRPSRRVLMAAPVEEEGGQMAGGRAELLVLQGCRGPGRASGSS